MLIKRAKITLYQLAESALNYCLRQHDIRVCCCLLLLYRNYFLCHMLKIIYCWWLCFVLINMSSSCCHMGDGKMCNRESRKKRTHCIALYAKIVLASVSLNMFPLQMSFEMIMPWCMINTLITRILYIFVYRLNMFCQITPVFSFMVTLITWILDTIMNRFNMKCQANLLCKL